MGRFMHVRRPTEGDGVGKALRSAFGKIGESLPDDMLHQLARLDR